LLDAVGYESGIGWNASGTWNRSKVGSCFMVDCEISSELLSC
jgi:hypothetical protein